METFKLKRDKQNSRASAWSPRSMADYDLGVPSLGRPQKAAGKEEHTS